MIKRDMKQLLQNSIVFLVMLMSISLIYFSELRGSIQPILSPVWLFIGYVLWDMLPNSINIMLLSAYHFGYPLFYSFITYKVLSFVNKKSKDNRKTMIYKILSTILIAIIFNLSLAPFEALVSNTTTADPFIFKVDEADKVYPGDKDRKTCFIWLRITLGAVSITTINFHCERIKKLKDEQ